MVAEEGGRIRDRPAQVGAEAAMPRQGRPYQGTAAAERAPGAAPARAELPRMAEPRPEPGRHGLYAQHSGYSAEEVHSLGARASTLT